MYERFQFDWHGGIAEAGHSITRLCPSLGWLEMDYERTRNLLRLATEEPQPKPWNISEQYLQIYLLPKRREYDDMDF